MMIASEVRMYVQVVGFHARARACIALLLLSVPCAGCGGDDQSFAAVGAPRDAATAPETTMTKLVSGCDVVEVDGDLVVEHEKDFTAHYRMGEAYTKTAMLFGGAPVEDDNALSNAYIFALDKVDAQMLAQKYADFYLCSSPGGQEASKYIISYDLVPATCDVYDRLLAALRQYDKNVLAGGDRTSLRFTGAPLQLESVIEDATGHDVTDQVSGKNFHLVTSIEQLTGESVLAFGTTN